jgi:hypothetical protein
MLRAFFDGERDVDILRATLEDSLDALDHLALMGPLAIAVPWVLRSAVRGLRIAVPRADRAEGTGAQVAP